MKLEQLAMFLFRGERLSVVRKWDAVGGTESSVIGRVEAADLVERWCHDPASWPGMLALYGRLTSDDLLGRPDADGHVIATLRRAFEQGTLTLERDVGSQPKADGGKGVHGRPPDKVAAPPPKPARAPARQIKEKTFVDVCVVDTEGVGLAGRPYKFQLPDGRIREGKLDSAGRLHESNIDPGTARLHILADPGQVVDAKAAETAAQETVTEVVLGPPDDFIVLRLVAAGGDPMSGLPVELTLADGTVRQAVSDDDGNVTIDGIPAGKCQLSIPHVDPALWKVS
jgi:hypothetical protein